MLLVIVDDMVKKQHTTVQNHVKVKINESSCREQTLYIPCSKEVDTPFF